LPANGQQSARRAFKLAAQDRHYWIGKAKQIRVTLCLRGAEWASRNRWTNTAAPPQLTLDIDATDDPLLRRAAWCT